MDAFLPRPQHRVEWGVATRSLPGERESGDLHVVCGFDGGVLAGVVDALGHGAAAAGVARRAGAALEAHAHEPLDQLVRRCHEALVGTRGVVLGLASIHTDDGTMAYLGVGNVETLLAAADAAAGGARATLLSRRGVVGANLPPLRPATIPLAPGDTLCFATDGVDPTFTADPPEHLPPQQWADRILARHARSSDDALALVVRFLGPAVP